MAAVAGFLGYSKGAESEQQFKDAQNQVTALRGQKAEIAAERDQAVGQLSHAAKILQERAAAVAPKSMDTAPVTASAGASSHAVPHAPLHGHAAALAEKGHEHHVNHADHATASKEHAAHAGHSV